MSTLIKSATIIDPASEHHGKVKNVILRGGKIENITDELPEARTVIEGGKLYVTPGWFDLRANFCDPGDEQKEDLRSGSQAAAAGGFTGVALLPNTKPVVQSKNDIQYIKSRGEDQVTRLYPMGAITKDCLGEDLTEMVDMHTAGAIAFTDGTKPVWNTDILVKTLQYLQKFDGLLINRAEDKYLTAFATMNEGINSTLLGLKGMPKLAEEIMIMRDLKLLEYAGGKIHFSTISTEGSVKMIRKAKKKGLNVTCDVALHNLVFDDSDLLDYDTNFKVNPPLREAVDIKALEKGLADGTIDAIVSSHMPQDEENKKLEFDLAGYGMINLQTFFSLLLQKFGDEWTTYISAISANPRKILGLPVPAIAVGNHAELTVVDTSREWLFNEKSNISKSDNSPLFGKKLKGKVLASINGTLTYKSN